MHSEDIFNSEHSQTEIVLFRHTKIDQQSQNDHQLLDQGQLFEENLENPILDSGQSPSKKNKQNKSDLNVIEKVTKKRKYSFPLQNHDQNLREIKIQIDLSQKNTNHPFNRLLKNINQLKVPRTQSVDYLKPKTRYMRNSASHELCDKISFMKQALKNLKNSLENQKYSTIQYLRRFFDEEKIKEIFINLTQDDIKSLKMIGTQLSSQAKKLCITDPDQAPSFLLDHKWTVVQFLQVHSSQENQQKWKEIFQNLSIFPELKAIKLKKNQFKNFQVQKISHLKKAMQIDIGNETYTFFKFIDSPVFN